MQEAREGHLADLTYVKLRKDGRVALLARLPYVGEGWYAKPACAHMLEAGIATWQDFLWSLDATAHVDPSCLAWALRKMEEAWPEEHLAKLSVNALIGLWARNVDLVYLMRTSNNHLQQRLAPARLKLRDGGGVLRRGPDPLDAGGGAGALPQVPEDRLQDLPKKYWPAVERLTRLRHADGTPVYRCEQVEQLRDPGLAAAAAGSESRTQ